MHYSNTKNKDGSRFTSPQAAGGVPSLFASAGARNKSPTRNANSYLNKRGGKFKPTPRPKINILSLVDGAIEDGATDEAKQKANADRSAAEARAEAPFLSLPKPTVATKKASPKREPIPTAKSPVKVQSVVEISKSVDENPEETKEPKQLREQPETSEKKKYSFRYPRTKSSVPAPCVPKPKSTAIEAPKLAIPVTPAWKARLNKQGKDQISEPKPKEEMIEQKPVKEQPATTEKKNYTFRYPRAKSPVPAPRSPKEEMTVKNKILSDLASAGKKKTRKERKKEKKEKKKEKKERKKKEEWEEPFSAEGVERYKFPAVLPTGRRTTPKAPKEPKTIASIRDEREKKKNIERHEKAIARLQSKIQEIQNQIDEVAMVSKQELADMEKEFRNTQETVRFRYLKDIRKQEKKNDKQNKQSGEQQMVIDRNQREIDEMRLTNQRLRGTIKKLPKQIAELKCANETLENANEDVFGHLEDLEKFLKKLQTDQVRLQASSKKCTDELLPRHRQELRERQQLIEAEKRIKKLYRDCIIRSTQRIDKCRNVDLIKEISMLVLDTEGDVNPRFDPKFLTRKRYDSSDDSSWSSDSDDSDSSD